MIGNRYRLDTLKLSLQRLKLSDVSFEDYLCTGNTVVIPAAAVSHLETSVSPLDAVICIALAIVGFLRFVNLDTGQKRPNSWH